MKTEGVTRWGEMTKWSKKRKLAWKGEESGNEEPRRSFKVKTVQAFWRSAPKRRFESVLARQCSAKVSRAVSEWPTWKGTKYKVGYQIPDNEGSEEDTRSEAKAWLQTHPHTQSKFQMQSICNAWDLFAMPSTLTDLGGRKKTYIYCMFVVDLSLLVVILPFQIFLTSPPSKYAMASFPAIKRC